MTNAAFDHAPRQFAIVAHPEGAAEAVVAWGQQFADSAVTVLRVPGTTIRQLLDGRSAETALAVVGRLGLGPLALVWTEPTSEGL